MLTSSVCIFSHAIGKFLDHEEQAIEVLGAIQSSWIEEKIEHSADIATVLRDSVTLTHPQFPKARLRTPMLKVALDDESIWMEERTGPITCIVKTSSTAQSLSVVERTIREHGATTFSVYSTHTHIQQMAEDVALRVGVALSFNFTDGVYVNQTNGFSDFQGNRVNPAGNACFAQQRLRCAAFLHRPEPAPPTPYRDPWKLTNEAGQGLRFRRHYTGCRSDGVCASVGRADR